MPLNMINYLDLNLWCIFILLDQSLRGSIGIRISLGVGSGLWTCLIWIMEAGFNMRNWWHGAASCHPSPLQRSPPLQSLVLRHVCAYPLYRGNGSVARWNTSLQRTKTCVWWLWPAHKMGPWHGQNGLGSRNSQVSFSGDFWFSQIQTKILVLVRHQTQTSLV